MEYLQIPLVFLSFLLFCYFFRNKNGLPTNYPIIGMIIPLLANINQLHDWLIELLQRSQLTFLFKGPWFTDMKFYLTCDPSNIHHIFSKNFANYPKGAKFNEMLDVLGDGIFNVDFDLWKYHRNMAHNFIGNPSFRRFLVQNVEDKIVRGLIPVLDHACNEKLVVDLQDLFERFTFDTICKLVMGYDLGSLCVEMPYVPFSKALDDVEEAILYRHVTPRCVWKFFRWVGVGKERKYKKAWEKLDDFIYKCVAKKKQEFKHREIEENERFGVDLLTLYMDNGQSQSVNDFELASNDDKFLRDTILNFFIAGRDTTSSVLSWFFYLITKNPNIESKIRQELDLITTTTIIINNLNNFVYLHGALCEALRLYPPVVFEAKAPTNLDTLPSGHEVHPNLQIVIDMYAMARMKSIWGDDCNEFKPERWISKNGTIRHEPSYKFLAFNAGPRNCLGKDMAFIQMKAVAATMIKNYKFEALEGHLVVPDISIILRMKYGFKVKVFKP